MRTLLPDAGAARFGVRRHRRRRFRRNVLAAQQPNSPEQSFKQANYGQIQSGHSLHRRRIGKMRTDRTRADAASAIAEIRHWYSLLRRREIAIAANFPRPVIGRRHQPPMPLRSFAAPTMDWEDADKAARRIAPANGRFWRIATPLLQRRGPIVGLSIRVVRRANHAIPTSRPPRNRSRSLCGSYRAWPSY